VGLLWFVWFFIAFGRQSGPTLVACYDFRISNVLEKTDGFGTIFLGGGKSPTPPANPPWELPRGAPAPPTPSGLGGCRPVPRGGSPNVVLPLQPRSIVLSDGSRSTRLVLQCWWHENSIPADHFYGHLVARTPEARPLKSGESLLTVGVLAFARDGTSGAKLN